MAVRDITRLIVPLTSNRNPYPSGFSAGDADFSFEISFFLHNYLYGLLKKARSQNDIMQIEKTILPYRA